MNTSKHTSRRHIILPDCQIKPGVPIDHLYWAGKYTAAMKPDVIVNIGDFWDMPSLSTYDKGKKSFEGRRYTKDVASGNLAMQAFMEPIKEEQERLKKNKKAIWNPRMVFTLGNHCHRIARAIEADAILEDVIGYHDLALDDWEVYPFLEVVVIDGVCYSHYFTSGVMGRPVSSARLMLTKKMMSCVMGHVQQRDIAFAQRADGTQVTGIFAGTYYQHDEDYLTPQTNTQWRGIWVLNEVKDGSFDELPVSINYLRKKYSDKTPERYKL